MKKISTLSLVALLVIVFTSVAYAKNENSGIAAVQNQNQVQTQNLGDDQQLMVQTAEQEEAFVGIKSTAVRSQTARENISEVAIGVEEILATRTLKGGIGDQVRVIAQEQKQSETQIQEQINKVDDRKAPLKTLIGPDFKALKNIEKHIEQNRLRTEALLELKNQLVNSGDIAMVQETINALLEQNVSLQELVEGENNEGSLLGWLIRLFVI